MKHVFTHPLRDIDRSQPVESVRVSVEIKLKVASLQYCEEMARGVLYALALLRLDCASGVRRAPGLEALMRADGRCILSGRDPVVYTSMIWK